MRAAGERNHRSRSWLGAEEAFLFASPWRSDVLKGRRGSEGAVECARLTSER